MNKNKFTFKEIEAILESELFSDWDCHPYVWFDDDIYSTVDDIEEEGEFKEAFRTLGSFELAYEFGGEGKGDKYYKVFYFKDHDVYIQFDGWYASHHGAEYEGMFEVKPEQVTVTQYKRVI